HNIKNALDKKNYREIFDTLESITESIDIFFDNVLVMDKDEEIKKNRLALLKNITDMYCVVADLSKIALAKG
ncbi:MAG: DALR anticodon-binding domain-containing protein, partial [Atribacterota bacterium]|nr:DALR anticodon-binding domain-containing protein [Atribacterota bacterium]